MNDRIKAATKAVTNAGTLVKKAKKAVKKADVAVNKATKLTDAIGAATAAVAKTKKNVVSACVKVYRSIATKRLVSEAWAKRNPGKVIVSTVSLKAVKKAAASKKKTAAEKTKKSSTRIVKRSRKTGEFAKKTSSCPSDFVKAPKKPVKTAPKNSGGGKAGAKKKLGASTRKAGVKAPAKKRASDVGFNGIPGKLGTLSSRNKS